MANDVSLFKSGALPAYLKNIELDAVTKSLAGGGTQNKRISIRGNVFRMISGGKEIAQNEDRAMNVVIVNAAPKVSRSFYEGVYDPSAVAPPTCWSADGVAPDKAVENAQHKNCADCPQNIAGSGQGNSRACRFSRRLAVVLENDLEGDIFQLTLPAQSLFGKGENGKLPLNAYADFLSGFNVPITAVVTEMRFDTDSATPKLTFKAIRPLTEEEFNTCTEQAQTPAAKTAVIMTVSQTDGVKKLESKAPVAVAEEPAQDEEPKKRESKKDVPTPAPKKDLKSVLDEWDD